MTETKEEEPLACMLRDSVAFADDEWEDHIPTKEALAWKGTGNLDPLELVDMDKVKCEFCLETHFPATKNCNCGVRRPTVQEFRIPIDQDAKKDMKKNSCSSRKCTWNTFSQRKAVRTFDGTTHLQNKVKNTTEKLQEESCARTWFLMNNTVRIDARESAEKCLSVREMSHRSF